MMHSMYVNFIDVPSNYYFIPITCALKTPDDLFFFVLLSTFFCSGLHASAKNALARLLLRS